MGALNSALLHLKGKASMKGKAMTVERAQTLIAAITSTLWDVAPNDPVPVGPSIYLALGMDLRTWETIAHVMSETGLAIVTDETVCLTDLGRDVGQKCSAIYAEAANQEARDLEGRIGRCQ